MVAHYFPNQPIDPDDAADQVAKQLSARSESEILIATIGKEPIGFATFTTMFPAVGLGSALFVRDLFVLEPFRSQGVGERLLRALATLAVGRGCLRLDWTAESANPRAMALYDRLGAQQLDRKVYFRIEGEALTEFALNSEQIGGQAPPTTFETDRTIMRPHHSDDFEAVASMWAEPVVVRHISGTPSTPAESWTRLLRYIGHWSALGYGYWAVTDTATGRFLGEVGFADFKRGLDPALDGLPEIGWVLHPDAHGQGLATETVAAALQWGDRYLEQKRTFCIVDPDHVASIKVAEKNGYRELMRASYKGQPTLVLDRHRPTKPGD
ncbi:MAG: GNAT family N-acetyltransferase [Pseudomonadota bacterium]